MCGVEKDHLVTAKIAGAELEVCDECSDLGTVIDEGSPEETEEEASESDEEYEQEYEYDTSGESTTEGTNEFQPEVEELVYDYDERIQQARQEKGLTKEELGQKLNEKSSVITRLEQGRSLPDENVRRKLEKELDIELTGAGGE